MKTILPFWNRLGSRMILILIPLSLLVMLLPACAPEPKASPDLVTVQLKWVHQAQFAGFYAAEEEGYYAEEDIEVTFKPGGVGVDIYEGISKGELDFSVVGADSLFVKRAEGLPVKAIATIYRINPFVMVAFADSGIQSPRDFVGRTVSLSGGYDEAQYLAMLKHLDIDPSAVNVVPYTYDDTPFLNGEIDATVSFAAGSLIPLKERVGERELTIIWPGDYGVHFYSDTLIARDDLIAGDPDLVQRFLRATLQGHRFAIENPEAAVSATMQYADLQDQDLQTAMFQASMPLIHTGEDQIGWMSPGVWQGMHDILLENGILETPLDVSSLYTLDFLEGLYAEE